MSAGISPTGAMTPDRVVVFVGGSRRLIVDFGSRQRERSMVRKATGFRTSAPLNQTVVPGTNRRPPSSIAMMTPRHPSGVSHLLGPVAPAPGVNASSRQGTNRAYPSTPLAPKINETSRDRMRMHRVRMATSTLPMAAVSLLGLNSNFTLAQMPESELTAPGLSTAPAACFCSRGRANMRVPPPPWAPSPVVDISN